MVWSSQLQFYYDGRRQLQPLVRLRPIHVLMKSRTARTDTAIPRTARVRWNSTAAGGTTRGIPVRKASQYKSHTVRSTATAKATGFTAPRPTRTKQGEPPQKLRALAP